MIINHIAEIYLVYCACMIAHEMSHVLAANLIGLRVVQVQLGENLFAVKIRRLSVSPNMLYGSSVDFIVTDLLVKTKTEICIFFMSGMVANLLTAIVGGLLMRWNVPLLGNALLWESLVLVLVSVLPVCPWSSDMKQLRMFMRMKKKGVTE